MRRVLVTAALLVVAATIAFATQAPAPDSRLTVAEVEKVAGVTGVKMVSRNAMTGAGGDLNFAGADGKMLLMVRFATASLYDSVKKGSTFNALVPGLGDEAFNAPPGTTPYALYVKKGAKAMSLTSFISTTKPYAPRLTMDQLKALAAIVLPRL
jgi:hypothetical protein